MCIHQNLIITNCKGRLRGTVSDRSYKFDEYGSYKFTQDNIDYALLLFVMTGMVLIGICCLMFILSIICGFIFGKFYQMRKNQLQYKCAYGRDSTSNHSDVSNSI